MLRGICFEAIKDTSLYLRHKTIFIDLVLSFQNASLPVQETKRSIVDRYSHDTHIISI